MDIAAVRAYALRDWAAIEEAKRLHARAAIAATAAENLGLSDRLREHARAFAPAAFDDAARARDLDAHVRLKRRIDDASAALRR